MPSFVLGVLIALVVAAPADGFALTEFDIFTPFDQGGAETNGIVLGPDRNLWVAEFSVGKIAKVGTDGKLISQIAMPPGSKPVSLANGPGGTVWATLVGTKQLARIVAATHAVELISTEGPGATCGPVGIAQGAGERMFFTLPTDPDAGCNNASRVGRVDGSGANVTTVPDRGTSYDIESLGDKLFIVDTGNEVIRRLNTDLGVEATTAPLGGFPGSLATGPDGNVWGTLFTEVGGVVRIAPGFGDNARADAFIPSKPLRYGFGITSGPEGAMYVGGRDSSRVARVRMDGSFSFYEIPNGRWPWQLAQGTDEDLWYTDIFGNRIARLISTRPRVSIGAPAVQGPTAATVTGTVNPRGSATSVRFEFGPTTGYGAATPPQPVASSVADSAVAAPLGGLAPATTYHYRMVAGNEEGETGSADATFTTPPAPIPRATFKYTWRHARARNRRSVRFTSLKVTALSSGATLRIYCRGGKRKRCPFTSKAIKRTGNKRNLAPLLRNRYLRNGAIIELRATKQGSIGQVTRLTVNKRATPVASTLCLLLGQTKPQACPRT